MTKPFPEFDLIRVVNLVKRTDRRAEMEGEFRRLGLADDPRVKFIAASAPDTPGNWRHIGENGCFMSHLRILTEAAAAAKSVLIVEDDADFTPAIGGYQWSGEGIFYGGYHAVDPANLAESDIVGSHCMGFSADTARQLVPYLTALIDHPSPPPIDGAYVWYRRAHPDVPTAFAVPPVAEQRSSRSDIIPGRFDRYPALRPFVSGARRVRRALVRSEFSFGLREAIIVSVLFCAISIYAAWRNS